MDPAPVANWRTRVEMKIPNVIPKNNNENVSDEREQLIPWQYGILVKIDEISKNRDLIIDVYYCFYFKFSFQNTTIIVI